MNVQEIYYELSKLKSNVMAWHSGKLSDVDLLGELSKFIDMYSDELQCIVGSFEQIKWERDIAILQLEEIGYELGEKIEKDCNELDCMCSCGNIVPKGCVCKCEVENKIKRAKIKEIAKFTTTCVEHFHKLVKNHQQHLFDDDDIQRELRWLCEQYYLAIEKDC